MIRRMRLHRKSGLISGSGRDQRGFTLIEILVTLFILAIGLLGLAGLLVEGMRNNQGAYLRTQASILAYDIADRMRANRDEAESGSYSGFTTEGASTNLPACATQAGGCSSSQQADLDKAEWARQIQSFGSDMPMLPGGVGTIQFDGATGTFIVSIQWDEIEREGDAGEQIAGDNAYALRFSL